MDNLKNTKIILASGSPRRQQFFKDLELNFEIRIKEIEEIFPETLKSQEITDYLAQLKATPFLTEISENDLLITSDTIVWLENKAVGKPKNEEDAFKILRNLSGKTHEVITSVCFTTTKKSVIINDCTKVTFSEISDQDIWFYIKKYQPMDKAGAYGIQDWIGLIAISKIEGSYTNVVGLPTEKVYKYLANFK